MSPFPETLKWCQFYVSYMSWNLKQIVGFGLASALLVVGYLVMYGLAIAVIAFVALKVLGWLGISVPLALALWV